MARKKELLLVSACLLGLNTKYDGRNNLDTVITGLQQTAVLIPVCPEQLGGLPTPRPAAEICGGDGHDVLEGRATVLTKEGQDRTAAFLRGAEETLKLAQALSIKKAVLKARSPSCGCGEIYDGRHGGGKKPGDGVCAALLLRAGIDVVTEEKEDRLQWLTKNGDS